MTFNNPEDVRSGVLDCLKNLQTDYLDLCMIHFPVGMRKEVRKDFDVNIQKLS